MTSIEGMTPSNNKGRRKRKLAPSETKLSSYPTLYQFQQQKKRKSDTQVEVIDLTQEKPSSHDNDLFNMVTPNLVKKTNSRTSLWVDKYKPTSLKDLAVHPKKIKDVAEYLLNAIYACRRASLRKKNSYMPPSLRILILTGPPGSGKTAAINLLLGANALINEYTAIDKVYPELIEFKNPQQFTNATLQEVEYEGSQKLYGHRESKLIPFLRQVKNLKYPSLLLNNDAGSGPKDKVLLVEDMPYLHDFKQRKAFQEAILEYLKERLYYPIVFILSDDTTKGSNACNYIFSKDILSSSCVKIIPFNTVSVTLVTKTLTKIAASENLLLSKEDIRTLAETSHGDIRSAINTIQFATLNPSKSSMKTTKTRLKINFPETKVMKKNRKKNSSGYELHTVFPDIGRDFTLSLYHSIGKVMHKKRLNDYDINDSGHVVTSLKDHATIKSTSPLFRKPLKAVPEDIIEKHISSQKTSDIFVQFIHENYTNFCEDIEDISVAADYFSCSDLLTSNFLDNQTLREYTSLLCVRGFMFSQSHPKKENRFSSFYKPHMLASNKTQNDNWIIVEKIFQSEDSFFFNSFFGPDNISKPLTLASRKTISSEILPFTGLILKNTPKFHPLRQQLVSPSQSSFIDALVRYSFASSNYKAKNQIDETVCVESLEVRNESDKMRNDVILEQIEKEIANLRLKSVKPCEVEEIEDW